MPDAIKKLNELSAVTDGSSVALNVRSGTKEVTKEKSGTMTVPSGTKTITLTYSVATYEYPYYVKEQSAYNDKWQVMVTDASGTRLFDQVRQVNAQLYGEPLWQSDGSTGELVETIDVSTLATTADTELTLTISSTNAGDSDYHTFVNARLGVEAEAEFKIKSVTHTGSEYFSIPRSGGTNTQARVYRLTLDKPAEATITKVTGQLVQNSNNGNMMTVVDEVPGTKAVLVGENAIDVTVTMDEDYPSTINSQPPTLNTIRYHFKVAAKLKDQTLEAEKDSETVNALWVLPDTISRFGTRDAGGDGWAAKGTYEWLVTNAEHVPAVNDISGEHGRDIGHDTHRRGTDIDTYHFTDLTGGAMWGTGNYNALRDQTIKALAGNATATQTVTDWIQTARTGLDTLTGLNAVAKVRFALGASENGLPAGWVATLMENGQLTVGAQVLNLGLASWSNDRVTYDPDHDNHVHIDLDDSQLNNTP